MNADFALLHTPALARRLVEISRVCTLDLDQQIATKAAEDKLPATTTDTPVQRAARQFLVDCEWRCVMAADRREEVSREFVLRSVIEGGIDTITVVCDGNVRTWQGLLKQAGAVSGKALTTLTAFEPEHQHGRREGVLLIDWSNKVPDDMFRVAALCREYPRTVIYLPPGHLRKRQASFHGLHFGAFDKPQPALGDVWWEAAAMLFPSMPQAIFNTGKQELARKVMRAPLWQSQDRDDLAVFYNVFLPSRMARYGAD